MASIPPASAARHATIPRWEEFRYDHGNVRRQSEQGQGQGQGRCYGDYYDYYSEEELETADALILLSLSRGGLCVSSSDSTSDINSGDSKSNSTEIPPVAVTRISRDENNPLVLRIRFVTSMPAKQISYKCDKCDREFSSPQALGGHKTSHRRKPTVPDLNAPLRVFECSICGDVFDSGMALGGHKTKHRSK